MKNKRKIALLLIAILIVAIGFIYNTAFTTKLNNKKDSKKLLRVKYLVMKNTKDDYEVKDVFPKHFDEYQTFADLYIGMEKQGDYYVVSLNNNTNKEILKAITTHAFALNNYDGIVIEDCIYDKKKQMIKVPTKYFKKGKKKLEIPVEVEFIVKLDSKKIKNIPISVNFKNVVTKKQKIERNGFDYSFSITSPISLKNKKFNVYINDGTLLEKNYYSFNKKTNRITLEVNPLLIDNISIEYENTFTKILNKNVANAAPTFYGSREYVSVFDVSEAPDESNGYASFYTRIYDGIESDDSYSSIYRAPTVAEGTSVNWQSIGLTESDFGYNGVPVVVSVEPSKMGYYGGPDYINTYANCIHITNASFGQNGHGEAGNYEYYWKVTDTTESGNYATDTIILVMNPESWYWTGTDTPGAIQSVASIVKLRYPTTEYGYVQVDKSHDPAEDTARSFELYDVGSTGDCTSIGSKVSDSVRSTDPSTPNRYYLGWNSTDGPWLELGKTYCVWEVGDNQSGTDIENNYITSYSNQKTSGGYNYGEVTLSDSSYTDSDEIKYTTATVTNTHRRYCTQVTKRDADNTSTKVSGIRFELFNSAKVSTGLAVTTGTDGVAKFSDLLTGGTYYVKEISPDGTSGYWNSHVNEFIEVTATEDTCNNTNVDDHKQYYCYRVRKKDANKAKQDINTYLSGFTFRGNGTYADNTNTKTTGSDGYAYFFTGTDNSTRTVTETGAATGYQRSTESKTVTPSLMSKNSASTTASNCTATAIEFSNYKYLINWFKEAERNTSGRNDKKTNGAKFKVKNSSGAFIVTSGTETITDSSGVKKTCYKYSSTNSSGSEFTSGANNDPGGVCISGIPEGTYTVTETAPASSHTFGSAATKTITASTAFTTSTVFDNKPTAFIFTKSIKSGDDAYSLAELKKMPFNIYSGNTKLKFILVNGVYEYAGNTIDPSSGTQVEDLYLNDSKKLEVHHLPVGTYSIKEKETDNCKDSKGNNCYGTGYYYPKYTASSSHQFTITTCSNSSANGTSCTTHVNATQSLTNVRTEIHFTKNDFYSYYNPADKVKFENNQEISAFDKIGFKLKDSNGNYLKLVKVRNVGNCTNASTDYAEYRYVPADTSAGDTVMNTCGGNIHITNLCRGKTYTVEEVSVPTNTVFTLPTPHPTVTYNIPQNEPNSISTTTGTKGVISDKPTRFVLWKLDAQTNTLADSEETIFNIYQCASSVTSCTKNNGTLVYFSARGTISGDQEDAGKQVYKYSKLNSSSGAVKDLRPYKGEVIMRYLPVDYKYVAYEVNAPGGYYQPSNEVKVEFVIPKTTLSGDAHIKSFTNEPTEIVFEKQDIYKYYSKDDQAKLGSNDKLLDTAKFSVRDKNGNVLYLKKMRNGVYRYLPYGEYSDKSGLLTEISTYNGKLMVTHLRREETYYIEEVKTTTPANFALPTNVPAPSNKPANWNWKGHPYVTYTLPKHKPTDIMGFSDLIRMISNTPTRVVFQKIDEETGEIVKDESTTFEVYQCANTVALCTKSQGTLMYFKPREEITDSENADAGKEVYKYSKLNSSVGAVSELHPYEGELIIRYLPADYKYVLYETTAPHGFYNPSEEDRETPFVISSDTIVNTKQVLNSPTEITFSKTDTFNYYNNNDINTENGTDKLFDTAKFVLRDENGYVLRVTETSERGIYNYASRCEDSIEECSFSTYNGTLKIRYLERGKSLTEHRKYYIEEIETTNPIEFVLPTDIPAPSNKPANWEWKGHPYVTYDVPAVYVPTANVIKIMDNEATRVVISKVNREDYTEKIDDETTTFKVYRCKSEDQCETSDDRTLIRFEDRITVDSEQAYKYSKLNNGTIKELHPYRGEVIIRYLPSGYKYVAVETKAPDGYYEPHNRETYFTVAKNTTNHVTLNNNDVPNDPTKIYFEKKDIYKYYSSSDQAKLNSSEKLLDTAKFVLRDETGNILKLKKIRDGLYRWIPVNSSNTIEEINTYNGKLTITHLSRTKKYYIEEVKTTDPKNFILPTNIPAPSNKPSNWEWKGHPYVAYTVPEYLPENEADVTNLVENTPTRIMFVKIDEKTEEVILDEKTTFNVYMCNTSTCASSDRTLVYFTPRSVIEDDNEDPGKEVYKYSKLNASNDAVSDLHPYNGELILRYLPGDTKYVLVETVAPDGYYNPSGGNEETFFEVSSSVLDTNHNIRNKFTKIILNKADIYGYYNNTDQVSKSDTTKIFDTAEFIIKDADGNTLSLKKVDDGEYRYIPVNDENTVQRMKTKDGQLIVTHLYRDSKYYIEEVSTTNPKHFILENNHPTAEYQIPIFVPTSDSLVTRVIQNKPTRLVFRKLDARTNNIVEDEKTTYNIYKCPIEEENCTKNNGELVYFTPRGEIEDDNEDPGKEVYKYSKLNNESGAVKDLHPYKGELILRYLDANYKYIAVEKVAPDGYYNPTDENDTTLAIISDSSMNNSYDVINNYTQIFFNKEDIYKYYTKNDRISLEESSDKVLDTAEFVLRDKNGNIVNLKDEYGTCEYRYIPVNESNTITKIHTCNGSLKITHLYRSENYYIEEVKTTTDENFILPTTVKKPEGIPSNWDWKGHPYVKYGIPENIPEDEADVTEMIANTPTRVAFAKRDKRTNEVVDDEKTTFNVYKCNKDSCLQNERSLIYFDDRSVIVGDNEDPGKEVYKYSKLNVTAQKDLHPYQGYLILRYLPAGNYVLVETVAPDGYYNPTNGVNDETLFTVRSSSYNSDKDFEELTDNVINTPTEIIFKKNDFYKYYNNLDDATLESNVKLFDTAKFVLRDENGNILDLKYTETNEEEGNVYRYLQINEDNNHTYINTYKGKLKITNLYRNKVYYIEEVKTTIPGNFILSNYIEYEGLPFDNKGHPVVKYTLQDKEPEDLESVTREIENIPTRVKIEKRDSKYNYLIPDETTTFELYQCESECHPTDYTSIESRKENGINIVYFEPRSILEKADGSTDVASDKGVEVYKYSKLNSSNGAVKDLHPDKGQLILRYLPSGYHYVLVETVAPVNYSLPEGHNAETVFTVDTEKVEVEEVHAIDKPVSLLIRKYAQDGELLEGAKFKIHEAKSCDMSVPANKVETNGVLKLKTIRNGVYEARETGDTLEFMTCQDQPDQLCSSINSSLTYNTEDLSYVGTVGDFSTLLNDRGESVEIEAGEALIQYLKYGNCYVIEEVKAPKGYSLPEKEEDRFVMVKVTDREQIFDTYEELVNLPSSFTFFKYDEYNNSLDGGKFKLQKLNEDKKYIDVTITKEELENGDLVYKIDPNSDEYIMETNGGKASIYYLEEGQYRVLEVEAPEGYELPKKTINVATFYVDEDGRIYGTNVIANKPKTERVVILPKSSAELIVNIQTGQNRIKYGLIIGIITIIIAVLIFIKRKK